MSSYKFRKIKWELSIFEALYIVYKCHLGYSYSDPEGLPTDQARVAEDLYNCLQQFYTLFPEFQGNDFFAFGESYAGKFVPTIAKKIQAENGNGNIDIQLAGIGIGDGFMSPPDSALYGKYLFEVWNGFWE